jgi:hypothetical protein
LRAAIAASPAIYFAGLWIRFQSAEQDFILLMDSNHLPGFVAVKPADLLAVLRRASMKVPTDSASAGWRERRSTDVFELAPGAALSARIHRYWSLTICWASFRPG